MHKLAEKAVEKKLKIKFQSSNKVLDRYIALSNHPNSAKSRVFKEKFGEET